jgi:N-acetylglucosaminyldiphosphoundecaprenol N-acetyl-beta-D-mannosaminyltransferase
MLYNEAVQTLNKIDLAGLLSGLSIFGKSKADLLALIEKRLNNKNELLTIATPNPEQVILAYHNPSFNSYLHQFDLLLPDGQGLVWAMRKLAKDHGLPPVAERIAGREVVAFLLHQAVQRQLKVLVVGGRDYEGGIVAAAKVGGNVSCVMVAAEQLAEAPLNEQVVVDSLVREGVAFPLYWTPAYASVATPTADEQRRLEQLIANLQPDLVLVAFGAPYQEEWVVNHASLLKQHQVQLAMVVGGTFDYLLGKVPAVPQFMVSLGLEWLFRLITQPWRWKRQLKLAEFVTLVLTQPKKSQLE